MTLHFATNGISIYLTNVHPWFPPKCLDLAELKSILVIGEGFGRGFRRIRADFKKNESISSSNEFSSRVEQLVCYGAPLSHRVPGSTQRFNRYAEHLSKIRIRDHVSPRIG